MKNKFITIFLLSLFAMFSVTSCGGDDDDNMQSSLIGKWYGTITYYNPVGGTKYQYITVELRANHTGSLEYEAPTSYSLAEFQWSQSGNIVKCNGVYASSTGSQETDFTMTLKISGDRLYPQGRFDRFILTKDNSITTDTEGNIVGGEEETPGSGSSSNAAIIDGMTRSEVEALVKKHVTAKATYSDYTWTITMESTLHRQLSSHTIEFGVGHGELSGNESVSVGKQAYDYSLTTSGDKKIAIFTNPFWFYYMFGVSTADKNSAALAEMFYASYNALKQQGLGNLTNDEKALYNDLVKELNSLESGARYSYEPSAQVLIDGKYFFTVARYLQK